MNRLRPMVALLAGLALTAAAVAPNPATAPPEPKVAALTAPTLDAPAVAALVATPALYSSVYASDHAPSAPTLVVAVPADVERPPVLAVGYDGSAVLRPPFLDNVMTTDRSAPAPDTERPRSSATSNAPPVDLRL